MKKKGCQALVRDRKGGSGPASWKGCEKQPKPGQQFCKLHGGV